MPGLLLAHGWSQPLGTRQGRLHLALSHRMELRDMHSHVDMEQSWTTACYAAASSPFAHLAGGLGSLRPRLP